MGAVAIGSIVAPLLIGLIGTAAAFLVVGSILPLLTFLSSGGWSISTGPSLLRPSWS
jgi:hypothetical protein